jgi:thiosulfate dehydrogenase
MRSCNGIRPPLGSEVSVAVTAYITWLSQGRSMAMNPNKPLGPYHVPKLNIDPAKADSARGRELYADFCASCHGENGQGFKKNPPVWGPKSYNAGAGLATLEGLASWLKVSMPLDDPSLSVDEARDLAAFLVNQPRPRFDLKEHLPPPDRRGEYNSEVHEEIREIPSRR